MLSALLVAVAPAPLPPGALPEEAFTELLETGTRQELVAGCERVITLGLDQRLRQLRQALLALNEATSSLEVVFADTRALLRCKAPDAALQVLERISPNVGPERKEWLLLQWRAASDGLDQRRAALALQRLSQGSAEVLDAQQLTLAEPQAPGELPIQRSALDVQAEQREAMGQERAALIQAIGSGSPLQQQPLLPLRTHIRADALKHLQRGIWRLAAQPGARIGKGHRKAAGVFIERQKRLPQLPETLIQAKGDHPLTSGNELLAGSFLEQLREGFFCERTWRQRRGSHGHQEC